MAPVIRVASCHASPVFLSAQKTTEKCVSLIREAARRGGAHVVAFPEAFIPAFPLWSSCMPPSETHGFFVRMAAESIHADGEEMAAVRAAARENRVTVSLGFSEKVHHSAGTLYNSNVIIGPDGDVLAHHRKLMPTFFEKLTWSPGDGHGLKVVPVEAPGAAATSDSSAKLGMLICGENTNPLARYALMAQGERIHITTWPAKWPTKTLSEPLDSSSASSAPGQGRYDNLAANRMRAAEHSFEAKCFSVVCSGFMSGAMVDDLVLNAPAYLRDTVSSTVRHSAQAETIFLDPSGVVHAAFTLGKDGEKVPETSLRCGEGILYADLDMQDTIVGKQFHDVTGGYQRLDVFRDFTVDMSRRQPIKFRDDFTQ